MRVFIILALILTFMPIFADTFEDYYPLSVGDYWIQHTDIWGGGNNPITFTMENEAIDQINGEGYVRKLNWIVWDDGTIETAWYTWLRSVSDGIEMAAVGGEPDIGTAQIFDTPYLMYTNDMLLLGNTYQVDIPEIGGIFNYTTEQVGASITVPAGTFTNCLVISVIITDSTGTMTQENEFYYSYLVGEVRNYGWSQFSGNSELELIEYDVQSESIQNEIPILDYNLANYPNPFNPETTISFSLNTENTEDTEIIIYNLKGQKIKQLEIIKLKLGINETEWNGTDQTGKPVSSGIYFYQLKAGKDCLQAKRMLLLK